MEEPNSVNPSESLPDNEQVVNDATPDQVAENQSQDTQLDSQNPSVGGNPQVEVDEMGVPWKNRAMEYRRKFEDVTSKQEEILSRLNTLQEGGQRKYSETELRAFSEQTDNPYHKAWASQEIEKLRAEQNAKLVRTEIEKFKTEQQQAQVKQQTYAEVAQNYSDAFVKDQAGNLVGWNNNHPLTQRIAYYMQDPDIQANPRGLKVAAALAYADLSRTTQPQTFAKEQKMKREIKNLQNKTLVEGSGASVQQEISPRRKAIDKLRQTGSAKDAADALKHIFKASGQLS